MAQCYTFGMIKAVFFDLYNTLARFYPPRELVQVQAAQALGIAIKPEGVVRGYVDADEFMTAQNARTHVARLSPEEQRTFFARYEQLVLNGAGVQADEALAARVWDRVRSIPYGLAPYDDAVPCLVELKAEGYTLGVVSNLDGDLDALCGELGIGEYVAVVMSSRKAGAEKPSPRIFQAALALADAAPAEAMHIGDQYNGDVAGARAAGMMPVLLDREGLLGHYRDVLRISDLDGVPALVRRLNAERG
jgi:HAD superfamily hydrolase (TIGR01549 family)